MKPKKYASISATSRKTRQNGKYTEISNPLALEKINNRFMRRLKEKK